MWGYNNDCRSTRQFTTYRSACTTSARSKPCFSQKPEWCPSTCVTHDPGISGRACSAPSRRRLCCETEKNTRRCSRERRPTKVEPLMVSLPTVPSKPKDKDKGKDKDKDKNKKPYPCPSPDRCKPCVCQPTPPCPCVRPYPPRRTPTSPTPRPTPTPSSTPPGNLCSCGKGGDPPKPPYQPCPPCPPGKNPEFFNKMCEEIMGKYDDSALDHEYIHFLLRITEDILRNDMYSNPGIDKVIECHFEANKGRLNEQKMREQINRLKMELNYPLENRPNIGQYILCGCEDKPQVSINCSCCSNGKGKCDCGNKNCHDQSVGNDEDVINTPVKESVNVNTDTSDIEKEDENENKDDKEKEVEKEKDEKEGKEDGDWIPTEDDKLKEPGETCNCDEVTKEEEKEICICVEERKKEDSKPPPAECNCITINDDAGLGDKEEVIPSEPSPDIIKSEPLSEIKPIPPPAPPPSDTEVVVETEPNLQPKEEFECDCIQNEKEEEHSEPPPNTASLCNCIIAPGVLNPDSPHEGVCNCFDDFNDFIKDQTPTVVGENTPNNNSPLLRSAENHQEKDIKASGECLGRVSCTAYRQFSSDADRVDKDIKPMLPVTSKLNSMFKMVQPDLNIEKKISHVAFYNAELNDVCHCTVSLKKTALKIETDGDEDQEYILVEGPVCIPMTMLKEKTIPVMIENLPSSLFIGSDNDPLRDSHSSRVNLFVNKGHVVDENVADSISTNLELDMTPQRDNKSETQLQSHVVDEEQPKQACEVAPSSDIVASGDHLGRGKEAEVIPPSAKISADFRDKYHYLLRDAATSVCSFDYRSSPVRKVSPQKTSSEEPKVTMFNDVSESPSSVISLPQSNSSSAEKTARSLSDKSSSITLSDRLEQSKSQMSDDAFLIDDYKNQQSGESGTSQAKIFNYQLGKKSSTSLEDTINVKTSDGRTSIDAYSNKQPIVKPIYDDEDYDHKEILKKLDEIPAADNLDKQNNNANAVTDKLRDFRSLDQSDRNGRFRSYMNNTDNFEIRRQTSENDEKWTTDTERKARRKKDAKNAQKNKCCY